MNNQYFNKGKIARMKTQIEFTNLKKILLNNS